MEGARKKPEPGPNKFKVMVYNPIAALTDKEILIGELLMEGFFETTAAWYLNISINTLQNHLQTIYRILGINTVTEFALLVWWHLEGRYQNGCEDVYELVTEENRI